MSRKKDDYESIVKQNLNICFSKNGDYLGESQYKDPDNYTNFKENIKPCILFPQTTASTEIHFSTDGLLSQTKLIKIPQDDVEYKTHKELYFIFRQGMEKCLIWPGRAPSINQARSRLGRDDRLDLLLINIQKFYNICSEFKEISVEFYNRVIQEIPNTAYAFLNIPTLIWLCSFETFNKFIEKQKLKEFVYYDNDFKIYYAQEWTNYYKELFERTIKYRNNNNMVSFEKYLKE